MTTEEFIIIDNTFNEALFLTKVNNIFVKFLTSIMLDKLNDVRHFISDDVYNYGENIINPLRKNNHRKMYDELNVKESKIHSIEVKKDVYIVNVYLQSRYMEYIINLSNGNIVSGNDSSRIQVNYMLSFTKKSNAISQGIAKKCPSCGAPINVNLSGKCEYCGSIYNQYDYDWILSKLRIC